ncbi:hypothetical protein POM88_023538 [Heracleum sosnowskyi]|uniref:Glucose-6-phosphate dehydrogenase C-terminal domain-containing protein n=1 Tax=Heracleum sosnowskyi TaxID=360622 RepID=A0AAD8MW08_9APIA|nr:hypothetical protein POM88_023538 [Heracleum sosnowskyi]
MGWVPFVMKAGKALHTRRAEITVQFRHVPGNLYKKNFGTNLDKATNEQAIYLKINNKVPGLGMRLDRSDLNLLYSARCSGDSADTEGSNWRDDLPETFENRDAIIAAVPNYEDSYIKVPKIRRSQHALINPAITIILRMGAGGHGVPPFGSPDGSDTNLHRFGTEIISGRQGHIYNVVTDLANIKEVPPELVLSVLDLRSDFAILFSGIS